MEILEALNFTGLIIGVVTFLIIGIFHPLVVKCEYYFGVSCWWWFLVLGILGVAGSLFVDNVLISTSLGVLAFSSFWTIKEVFEQKQRAIKGWTKKNPKRGKEYYS
ncbi:MAG: DUF4491 family protein [Bacteroidetes bacterium]|nr:DUF4491 family protein [Bacteroidota bacterium]